MESKSVLVAVGKERNLDGKMLITRGLLQRNLRTTMGFSGKSGGKAGPIMCFRRCSRRDAIRMNRDGTTHEYTPYTVDVSE